MCWRGTVVEEGRTDESIKTRSEVSPLKSCWYSRLAICPRDHRGRSSFLYTSPCSLSAACCSCDNCRAKRRRGSAVFSASEFSSVATNARSFARWQVALGALPSGRPCGSLRRGVAANSEVWQPSGRAGGWSAPHCSGRVDSRCPSCWRQFRRSLVARSSLARAGSQGSASLG